MTNQIDGICISAHSRQEYMKVKSMIGQLSKNTIVYHFDEILEDINLLKKCDYIFTVGGDGSVAWLVGKFYDTFKSVKELKPIIPVIRPESVGYLKQLELNPEKFKKGFLKILNGDLTIQNRTILTTKIGKKAYVAVNEIYLNSSPHLGKFTVFLKEDNGKYRPATSTMADGAMIVTSVGSTGWSLSYHGQINLDEDVLELIFAGGIHSSANFILPRRSIKLTVKLKNSIITQDTLESYQARRKKLGLIEDPKPIDTLEVVYGSRVIIDGKIVSFGIDEIVIQSDNSIPFVFLARETKIDKARKLTKKRMK